MTALWKPQACRKFHWFQYIKLLYIGVRDRKEVFWVLWKHGNNSVSIVVSLLPSSISLGYQNSVLIRICISNRMSESVINYEVSYQDIKEFHFVLRCGYLDCIEFFCDGIEVLFDGISSICASHYWDRKWDFLIKNRLYG